MDIVKIASAQEQYQSSEEIQVDVGENTRVEDINAHIYGQEEQQRKGGKGTNKGGNAPRLYNGWNPQNKANYRAIICPFLSAAVREGALPVKKQYTRQELEEFSVQAGIAPSRAKSHSDGNFRNNPTMVQDLFNMEGATNEHTISTGVNDCKTFYSNCKEVPGNSKCQVVTPIENCILPNIILFESMWAKLDRNRDGLCTLEEMTLATEGPDGWRGFIVDRNPIGAGNLRGSMELILATFGNPTNSITKKALRTLFVTRKFPTYYTRFKTSMRKLR